MNGPYMINSLPWMPRTDLQLKLQWTPTVRGEMSKVITCMHCDCMHFFLSSISFSAMNDFYSCRSTEQVGRHLSCEEALEMYSTLTCLCQRWRVQKKKKELWVKFPKHLNAVICFTVLSWNQIVNEHDSFQIQTNAALWIFVALQRKHTNNFYPLWTYSKAEIEKIA